MSAWPRVLLTLCALGSVLPWGDGAPVYARIGAQPDGTLMAYSEPVVAENTDIPVHDEIVNASGQVWARLCLRLEHLNAAMTEYVPSRRDNTLRFGIESLPDGLWSRTAEVRINGIYAGRAGGNWDVGNYSPEAVEFVFRTPQIRPGDRVTLRFHLHDSAAIHQWRIRHRAAVGSASCGGGD